jgi:Outer membrane protein beta-barrel domain
MFPLISEAILVKNNVMAVFVCSALLMAAGAQTATAQTREGFTFTIGVGVGGADVTCDNCSGSLGDDIEYGPAFNVRVGRAANKHLVGTAELTLWGKKWDGPDGTDVSIGLGNLMGTFQVYPSATSGFYLKAGAGMARARAELKGINVKDTETSKLGFGYQAGMGWDIPAGRIAITPEITAWYGRVDKFISLPRWRHGVIQATIGVTFP